MGEISDFIESQRVLDYLSYAIRAFHFDAGMPEESDEEFEIITKKTLDVMQYMETVCKDLETDEGVRAAAEKAETPIGKVIEDMASLMLMYTVAKQARLIEKMTEGTWR